MPDNLGFEKLLSEDGFFARLFGRSPSGSGRELLYGSDLPLVLLTGGPGMGKGRLLRAVRDRFAAKVPVIYLDCGSAEFSNEANKEPNARSAATEALAEAAGRLNTWEGTGGSFAFPRLFAGLAVVATGVQRHTVGTELERYEKLAHKHRRRLGVGNPWQATLRDIVHNLLSTIATQTLTPYSVAVLDPLLDQVFARLTPRGRAELERIYGTYPGAAGQPQHGLRELARDFQTGDEARERAEGFLFRALREDLEAAYASASGKLTRVGRPGLLLDRGESLLGEQLLRAVLADRRGGQRDRVVVVSTARRADGGALLYGGLPPDEVESPAEFRPAAGAPPAWVRSAGGDDADTDRAPLTDGALLLRMPFLTGDQIRQETERRQRSTVGTNRRIDDAVARLSGGRPHSVVRLADAAASYRMPVDANDRELLDVTLRLPRLDPPEQQVVEVLLQELVVEQLPVRLPEIHRARWLDLLMHLSVAHDEECGSVLLEHHQGQQDELKAYQVSQLLTDTGWPSCERHFIGDFGLRQLLVHRLHRTAGHAWDADHRLLQDHYEERSQAGETSDGEAFHTLKAHQMNHHLVSGGADDVVRYLAAGLPGRAQEWCRELLEIAQAPYPGDAVARRDRALGQDEVAGTPLERTVDQLLHAVWLAEERTRPIGRETARTLAKLLDLLSIMDIAGAGQLGRTATDWSGLAENEQPLLPCTCTGRLGRRR